MMITYIGHDRVKLRYYGYDHETGCYNIHLTSYGGDTGRIWVSDDDGEDRDIDTENYVETGKRLCTKWAHIDLSQRRPLSMPKADDGSGI